MTRLGELLDFGKVLKAFAIINLSKSPTFLGNFCQVSKFFIFLMKSFLGNFYRHLVIFSGHTESNATTCGTIFYFKINYRHIGRAKTSVRVLKQLQVNEYQKRTCFRIITHFMSVAVFK